MGQTSKRILYSLAAALVTVKLASAHAAGKPSLEDRVVRRWLEGVGRRGSSALAEISPESRENLLALLQEVDGLTVAQIAEAVVLVTEADLDELLGTEDLSRRFRVGLRVDRISDLGLRNLVVRIVGRADPAHLTCSISLGEATSYFYRGGAVVRAEAPAPRLARPGGDR